MDSLRLMPDPLDIRETVFTNLLLLGFDANAHENKTRIQFGRDMFSLPNRKAMEIVMHFLFTKLKKSAAKQAFKNCWPVTDKRSEQEFTKIIVEWLTKIRRENPDCHLPVIVRSLFLSPSGEKFYRLLLHFTTYVLKEKSSTLKGKVHFGGKSSALPIQPFISTPSKAFYTQINRSLKTQLLLKHSELISLIDRNEAAEEICADYYQDLTKENYKLSKQKREVTKKIQHLIEQMEYLLGKRSSSSKDSLKRSYHLKKFDATIKEIYGIFAAQKSLQEKIATVLNQSGKQHKMDGSAINEIKVPDVVVKECENQLHLGKKIKNIFEDKKINLNSLVNLWNLSLNLIEEVTMQFPLPNFDSDELYVQAQVHSHASSLKKTKELREAVMEELLPSLHSSIFELNGLMKMNNEVSMNQPQNLELLPETPPFDFQSHQLERGSELKRYLSRDQVATPDAVNHLMARMKLNTPRSKDPDSTPIRKTSQMSSKKLNNLTLKTPQIVARSSAVADSSNRRGLTAKKTMTSQKKKALIHEKRKPPEKLFIKENPSKKKENIINSRIPLAQPRHSNIPEASAQKSDIATVSARSHVAAASTQYIAETAVHNDTINADSSRKAHEILLDQIATSVLRSTSVCSSGASSEEDSESNKIHAIDNPMEAFSDEAFKSRDKVPRTPVGSKSRQEENPFQFRSPLKQIREVQTDMLDLTSEDLEEKNKTQAVNLVQDDEDVDKTPVASQLQHDEQKDTSNKFNLLSLKERYSKIKSRGNTDKPDKYEGKQHPTNEFTPSVINTALSDNIKTPSNFDDMLNDELCSNQKLFFENNKLLFSDSLSPFATPNHNTSNEFINYITPFKSPFTPKDGGQKASDEIINFITPFKSPFTPTNKDNKEENKKQIFNHALFTPTELHFTPHELSRDVTLEEVESFIDEVVRSTGHRSLPGADKKKALSPHENQFQGAELISFDTPSTNNDTDVRIETKTERDPILKFSFDEDEI